MSMTYSSSSSEFYSQQSAFSSANLLHSLGRDQVWFGGGTPGSSQASQPASQASQPASQASRQDSTAGSRRRRRHSPLSPYSSEVRKRVRCSPHSLTSPHHSPRWVGGRTVLQVEQTNLKYKERAGKLSGNKTPHSLALIAR